MSDIDFAGKRYWIVGASDGLGAALAGQLSRAGAELILSARSEEALGKLADALPGRAQAVPMDVAEDESVRAAAARIGPVDGVILVAGVYWPFGAKEWNADQAVAMANINYTGYVRVLGEVMPDFAAKDAGHIVIVSSLTAYRGLPGSVGYSPTKAAALSLAECLHADLRQTGIRVQVALPGFIRTRLTDKNSFAMPSIMEPEHAARIIFEQMVTGRFKKSFPSPFAWIFRGAKFLPDWLWFRLIS